LKNNLQLLVQKEDDEGRCFTPLTSRWLEQMKYALEQYMREECHPDDQGGFSTSRSRVYLARLLAIVQEAIETPDKVTIDCKLDTARVCQQIKEEDVDRLMVLVEIEKQSLLVMAVLAHVTMVPQLSRRVPSAFVIHLVRVLHTRCCRDVGTNASWLRLVTNTIANVYHANDEIQPQREAWTKLQAAFLARHDQPMVVRALVRALDCIAMRDDTDFVLVPEVIRVLREIRPSTTYDDQLRSTIDELLYNASPEESDDDDDDPEDA